MPFEPLCKVLNGCKSPFQALEGRFLLDWVEDGSSSGRVFKQVCLCAVDLRLVALWCMSMCSEWWVQGEV